ncbi:hypothetical protein Ancab_008460 [Ancistrocladus abbreviatus]
MSPRSFQETKGDRLLNRIGSKLEIPRPSITSFSIDAVCRVAQQGYELTYLYFMQFYSALFFSQEIGLGLVGFGVFFTFLGVVLFFDKGLLALGNIFWLMGVTILLGWRSTLKLFTNSNNYKGSVSFLLGLFFLFVRWPMLGIILEIYGCFVIFSGFGPSIKVFLFQIPVIGWVLRYLFSA